MWLTFGLTILILSAWIIKMVVLKKFWIQKTPLDIPIVIFLVSLIISTIFSWDIHVSVWGYYSRFNGGLLSIFSYIILYYALASNFSLARGDASGDVRRRASSLSSGSLEGAPLDERAAGPRLIDLIKRILVTSLFSGTIVALWGLPSHFGYDPTCFLFRGSLDVSCWTEDFQPKLRIFSTLGQPAWLGAYLAILSPLVLALFLNSKRRLFAFCFLLLSVLFYVDILFTKSRAALIAFWISIACFVFSYYLIDVRKKVKKISLKNVFAYTKPLLLILAIFLIATAVVMSPFELKFQKGKIQLQNPAPRQTADASFASGGGGTESGKIRLFVWTGAINAWLHNPFFGTGVETFAYSYYKYKPVGHNLTSEWNFLYNKAHNEYLNYLATTGIVGLGTYMAIIISFLYKSLKFMKKNKFNPVISALVAGYISILVTNFFGFSVVIINLYFFIIPLLVFVLSDMVKAKNVFVYNFDDQKTDKLSFIQKLDIFVVIIVTFYLIAYLVNFWFADKAYALGSNLSRSGMYEQAYLNLQEATQRIDFEPTFKDELASNDSILALSLLSSTPEDEKQASAAATLAQGLAREAIIASTSNSTEHSKNVVFWKTKVRVFYTLSQVDPKYLSFALDAIKKAAELAPTDANVSYNLGLLYGQSKDIKKAVDTLNNTIKLKPNYVNAYYALGLFYRQLATNDKGVVVDLNYEQKAIDQMEYILKKIDPKNEEAKQALESWKGTQ